MAEAGNPRRWGQFWLDLRCWLVGHKDEFPDALGPICRRCDRPALLKRGGRYPLRNLGKVRPHG